MRLLNLFGLGRPAPAKFREGDVFEVRLDASTRRFFQFVAVDSTQLFSAVVRVFRDSHDGSTPVDVEAIAGGAVDFHAHVLLAMRISKGLWRKVGRASVASTSKILFRASDDYGTPGIRISKEWFVWKINGAQEYVGPLPPKYEHAEIGVVVPTDSLLFRMREGRYDFFHPDYKE
jgi:hypothetical protein